MKGLAVRILNHFREKRLQLASMRVFCGFVRREAELACERGEPRMADSLVFHHNHVADTYNNLRPVWRRKIAVLTIGRELVVASPEPITEYERELITERTVYA